MEGRANLVVEADRNISYHLRLASGAVNCCGCVPILKIRLFNASRNLILRRPQQAWPVGHGHNSLSYVHCRTDVL